MVLVVRVVLLVHAAISGGGLLRMVRAVVSSVELPIGRHIDGGGGSMIGGGCLVEDGVGEIGPFVVVVADALRLRGSNG